MADFSRIPADPLCEAKLASILKVDLKSDLFTYEIDERALDRARMMKGKLILVTNVPDLQPVEIVSRYKSLAEIERGFRVLRMPLKARDHACSPERAVEIARRILLHQVTLHRQHATLGLTTLSPQQKELHSTTLPTDIEALKTRVLAYAAMVVERETKLAALQDRLSSREQEIEHLKLRIAKLRRMQFGRKSEKLQRQIKQLELRLEDLQADEGVATAATESKTAPKPRKP